MINRDIDICKKCKYFQPYFPKLEYIRWTNKNDMELMKCNQIDFCFNPQEIFIKCKVDKDCLFYMEQTMIDWNKK